MDYALVAILGIVAIVAAAAWGPKLGVAAPLILVVLGVGYSLIPGVPPIEVEPDVILMGVLPPLLYAAAITVPFVDFRRNLSTIGVLSVVLVVASAFGTGLVLFVILPDLNLAAAIALGAVISPTDVVAATAIAKRIGLPARLVAILEGEGLVNDATALVLLRTAVAATAATASGADIVAWSAIGQFFYAVFVAIAIGVVVGIAAVWVRRRLDNPMLDTAISFAVPFVAYIPAEELHGSGVIAVVAAGLYSGHQSAKMFTAQSRISERFNWRTVQFVLENGVFLLMGAQISTIISDIDPRGLPIHDAVLVGLLLTGILVVIRYVFVWPLMFMMRRQQQRFDVQESALERGLERLQAMVGFGSERFERRRKGVERRLDRRRNDIAQLRAAELGWRGGVVLGWAGMRGVVTLAAAQSLPRSTPYYEQLVLIAFVVAVTTLLVQGGTLPFVIRLTGIRGTDRVADRRELASLLELMSTTGLAVLDRDEVSVDGVPVSDEVVERVRQDALIAVESAWERADHFDEEQLRQAPHQQYRSLRREVLAAERDVLLEARSRGAYPSRILQRAQTLLDLEEARLQQIDTGGRTEE